jgi:hypothetical protein
VLRLPFILHVDHASRRVMGIGSGTVTSTDFADYIRERVRNRIYSYPQVIDLRLADVDLPPGQTLFAHAMEVRHETKAGPIPRTAIIAQQGTASFGHARQLATQMSFARAMVEVFTNIDDAETWLAAGVRNAT